MPNNNEVTDALMEMLETKNQVCISCCQQRMIFLKGENMCMLCGAALAMLKTSAFNKVAGWWDVEAGM